MSTILICHKQNIGTLKYHHKRYEELTIYFPGGFEHFRCFQNSTQFAKNNGFIKNSLSFGKQIVICMQMQRLIGCSEMSLSRFQFCRYFHACTISTNPSVRQLAELHFLSKIHQPGVQYYAP